jgi:hypothetical protein
VISGNRCGCHECFELRDDDILPDGTGDLMAQFAAAEKEQRRMPRMPKRCISAGSSSTFTFAIRKRPSLSLAISWSRGAIIWHGPHHGARKSTSTGTGDCSTAFSKLAALMLMGSFIFVVRW